jgi:hypothetical protein
LKGNKKDLEKERNTTNEKAGGVKGQYGRGRE